MILAGLHGDLSGIVGNTLPAVKVLELPTGADNVPDSNLIKD